MSEPHEAQRSTEWPSSARLLAQWSRLCRARVSDAVSAGARTFPSALATVLLVSVWFILLQFVDVGIRISSIEGASGEQVRAAAAAMVANTIGRAITTAIFPIMAIAWGFAAYAIFRFVEWVLGAIYLLLYPVKSEFFRIERRFDVFLGKRLFLQLTILKVTFAVVVARQLLKHESDFRAAALQPVVNIAGVAILAAVPLVFGIVWINALVMSFQHPRARFIRMYLFSASSRRWHLLGTMVTLVFLALLARVLLPVLFKAFQGVAGATAAIVDVGFDYGMLLTTAMPTSVGGLLPASAQLPEYFNVGSGVERLVSEQPVRETLLLYFFATALLGGFIGTFIPATVAATLSHGYRVMVKSVLATTARSTVLSVAIAAVIEFGYDLGGSRGFLWIAIFGFVLSFLSAHDKELSGTMEAAVNVARR